MSAALRDAIQLRLCPDDDAAARDGGRRERHFVKGVFPQHLELRTGLDDEGDAVFAEREDLAVVCPWRSRESAGVGVYALAAVDLLTRPGIVAREEPAIEERVEVIAVHERG